MAECSLLRGPLGLDPEYLGGLVVPWEQAIQTHFDCVTAQGIAASHMTLPTKLLPDSIPYLSGEDLSPEQLAHKLARRAR